MVLILIGRFLFFKITMADSSLPRIAILGAGPIGLEATLYARYLGYQVDLIERGSSPAENMLLWGHVRLFTPFSKNVSPLGMAALQAQDPAWQPPAADQLLTGAEFQQEYLLRLAESDLVAGPLQCETEVLAVGRKDWLKNEGVGNPDRGESPFVLLLNTKAGMQQLIEADVVIDCTGTYGNHNWLGQGGISAVGEVAASPHIQYGLPDVLGRDREQYQGKSLLVVGAGYSAATVITQLAQLADVQINWLTRSTTEAGPIARLSDDRLASRDALAIEANRLASREGPVVHHTDKIIVAVEYRDTTDDFSVLFDGELAGEVIFDRIVANVGYRPDNSITNELQVHTCYATDGPMKLAAQLLGNDSADCLDQSSSGPQSLITPEPNYYILGSKSYGRGSQFLISVGLEQIREVFTLIGERADLDIYATMPQLDAE